MSTPHSAAEVLQHEFLGIRARLVDLAATLDRIERAEGEPGADLRWEQLRRAIGLLSSRQPNRAEQMQLHFSLPYDADWRSERPG